MMSHHLLGVGLGYDNGEPLRLLEDVPYVLVGATLMVGAAEGQDGEG